MSRKGIVEYKGKKCTMKITDMRYERQTHFKKTLNYALKIIYV